MPQVKRLGVAGSKAWCRRSVFLPGTCDTNQSHVPFIVACPPSFSRPATINNQTCDVCQRDFLVDLLPGVDDSRCGRGLRGGWTGPESGLAGACGADWRGPAERIGGGLRGGTPLRGYPSHCAMLAGPSRSRSHGRLRRPQSPAAPLPDARRPKRARSPFSGGTLPEESR